jgi:hypothetical protein
MYDSILSSVEKDRKEMYGEYTAEEQKIIEIWNKKLADKNILEYTVFSDANFLREFLNVIPNSEQFEYVKNTCDYYIGRACNYDYVIVTRRAVPSETPKPEVFWTTEHRVVISGLRRELPEKSPQRLHSVVMVSTLGNLKRHGFSDTSGGSSDGEIVIDPNKNFSDFLFMYKPEYEIKYLDSYLKDGGITREALLLELKKTANKRMRLQGLEVDIEDSLDYHAQK